MMCGAKYSCLNKLLLPIFSRLPQDSASTRTSFEEWSFPPCEEDACIRREADSYQDAGDEVGEIPDNGVAVVRVRMEA